MIAIDTDLHIPIYSPTCSFCKHLNAAGERCCTAYPEPGSIPMDIWNGASNHMVARDGDNGIQFEPVTANLRGEL